MYDKWIYFAEILCCKENFHYHQIQLGMILIPGIKNEHKIDIIGCVLLGFRIENNTSFKCLVIWL